MKDGDTFWAYAAPFGAALLAAMLSGCFSLSLTHEIADDLAQGPPGGRYNIKNVAAPLAVALRKHAPKGVVFTDEDAPDAIILNLCVSEAHEDKDTTSSVQCLPGLLTLCTFPALMERTKSHSVSISSQLGKHEIGLNVVGRETVCWTPLGWLPFALPLDDYDYTGCDLMKTWRQDKNAAWTNATMNAVAKTVISTLTKARYDAYLMKIVDDARRRKNGDEARKRECVLQMAENAWPQEAMLRDFALKETTGLWDVVVSFRAEISIRKNRLQEFGGAIKGFGRNPEEDTDYIKCKGEYDAARDALVQIFKSLETAYLAACKNEALYKSCEARARTRKTLDECSRVAADASKKILSN